MNYNLLVEEACIEKYIILKLNERSYSKKYYLHVKISTRLRISRYYLPHLEQKNEKYI